jgi:hypothetical protein
MKHWSTIGALILNTEHGSRLLTVTLFPAHGLFDSWMVTAAEVPFKADQSIEEGIDTAFAEHSHKNLGAHRGLALAMQIGEAFSKKWQRTRASGDRCSCEEIPLAFPKTKTRKRAA